MIRLVPLAVVAGGIALGVTGAIGLGAILAGVGAVVFFFNSSLGLGRAGRAPVSGDRKPSAVGDCAAASPVWTVFA